MRTTGLNTLITGGGSGIGLALARRLAPDNEVVIAGRDEAKLASAAADIPRARTLRLDITSEEEARGAVAWLDAELGGLDVLVNNAGIGYLSSLDDPQAEARIDEEVRVNLVGTLRMTRLAIPLLRRADQGAIVFVSSAVALVAAPGLAVYAATKAAMHSLSRSLRRELTSGSSQREPASGSIRVFEVLPPWVDTDLARSLRVAKIPPEDVADAVVRGLARDRYQIAVGQIRALLLISRLAPRMADALFARATREVGAGSPRSCGLTGARIERERRGSDVEEDGGAPIHQRSGRAQLG